MEDSTAGAEACRQSSRVGLRASEPVRFTGLAQHDGRRCGRGAWDETGRALMTQAKSSDAAFERLRLTVSFCMRGVGTEAASQGGSRPAVSEGRIPIGREKQRHIRVAHGGENSGSWAEGVWRRR